MRLEYDWHFYLIMKNKEKIITGIYKITNPVGQVYVGASINVKRRWLIYAVIGKKLKNQRKIYDSLCEYGICKHIFEIIEECDKEQLNERERYWQEHYEVLENGLNCFLNKTIDKPRIVSEETKRLLSESKKGEKHHLFGKKCPEHGLKLKGRKFPERGLLQRGENNHMFGKKRSEETRKKISNTNKANGKMLGNRNPMFGKIRPEVGVRNAELKGKRIINTNTDEIYISAVNASAKLGIPLSTVKRSLHKNYSEKYNIKYV